MGYNAIRDPKLCGYSLTGIIDQPAGEGLLTEWRKPKLGILDAMSDCLAPLRWCLFVEPMHAYAGRPFRIEAVMANDGVLPPGRYPCRFRMHGPQGSVWEKTSMLVVPAANSHGSVPLAHRFSSEPIVLDVPAGVYQLAAELERGGGGARGGRIDFRISRTDALPKIRHAVAAVGRARRGRFLACGPGSCLPAVRSTRWPAERRGAGGRRPQRARSRRHMAGTCPPHGERLGRPVSQARRLSVMWGTAPDGFPWHAKAVAERATIGSTTARDIAKPHPVFECLAAGGIMDWYCYLQVTPQLLFDGQDPPEEVIAAAVAPGGEQEGNAGAFRSGVIAASYRFGAGRFIINTLRILENLDKNPAADRLLVNMIRYAAGLVERTPATLGSDFQDASESHRLPVNLELKKRVAARWAASLRAGHSHPTRGDRRNPPIQQVIVSETRAV